MTNDRGGRRWLKLKHQVAIVCAAFAYLTMTPLRALWDAGCKFYQDTRQDYRQVWREVQELWAHVGWTQEELLAEAEAERIRLAPPAAIPEEEWMRHAD